MTTTNFVHFEHAPPKSWDHFEEICADIFQREWRDNALVRHGRAGQKQHGVDIVGRVGAVWPVGVQCKKKSHWPIATVTAKDLLSEIEKAKTFRPALKQFYLVSTAPDDEVLQKYARDISEKHEKEGLFSVCVLGWSELMRRATLHADVAEKHFGFREKGPSTPLLYNWNISTSGVELEDEELEVVIRELLLDFQDFPNGRITMRWEVLEKQLMNIQKLRGTTNLTIDVRQDIISARKKLSSLKESERMTLKGLELFLCNDEFSATLSEYWDIPTLIRSYIEYGLGKRQKHYPDRLNLRLHPPGTLDGEWETVSLASGDAQNILDDAQKLKKEFPKIDEKSLDEMSKVFRYRYGIPGAMFRIVREIEDGNSVKTLRQRGWLRLYDWKYSLA